MNQADTDKQKQFLSLYGPVSGRLSRFILTLVWNPEDARDIAADTVLIAFQKFDKVRSDEVFIYYLFSIASRLVKQFHRKKRLFGIFASYTKHQPEPVSHIPETGLDMEVLHRALNKLNDKEREAIVLFEIAGFSLAEIQEIQKDSLSAVKSRLARGRAKLSNMINDQTAAPAKRKTGAQPLQLLMVPAVPEPLKQGNL